MPFDGGGAFERDGENSRCVQPCYHDAEKDNRGARPARDKTAVHRREKRRIRCGERNGGAGRDRRKISARRGAGRDCRFRKRGHDEL